jgi:pilus assembly protein CpaF
MNDVYQEMQRCLLGPLAKLLEQTNVTELILNGPKEVFIERGGRLEPAGVAYSGGEWQLLALARNIAEAVGRPLDEGRPILDARLANGSRVHLVIPPASRRVHLNIGPFRRSEASLNTLTAWNMLTPAASEFLRIAVAARRSAVIAGPTGAGKSTVLNALAGCIPPEERILVIEDTRSAAHVEVEG